MLSCRVLSAGTAAREGRRADPLAQESLGEWNLDLSWHRTRALTPNLVDHADWIFTMTRAHRESIVKMMPDADERVRLFSPEGDDIPDPVTGSIAAYRHVRDLVGRAMPAILKALAKPQ
jgi:protein-tyrosine phosphatase